MHQTQSSDLLKGKKGIRIMALMTLVGFPLLGLGINAIFHIVSLQDLYASQIGYGYEIILGVPLGILFAALGWKLVKSSWMKGAYDDIEMKIKQFELTLPDIIFISLCAGIGEEILFRGVIQPAFGVWLTSVVFVGIHGYLRPDQWRRSLYGVYMTLVIAVMGYMRIYWGLTSAIVAHATVDMVLFYYTFQSAEKDKDSILSERYERVDLLDQEE